MKIRGLFHMNLPRKQLSFLHNFFCHGLVVLSCTISTWVKNKKKVIIEFKSFADREDLENYMTKKS